VSVGTGREPIDLAVLDGVTIVRLNRPPVNALDLSLVGEAVATISGLEGPVVLTGTGGCFSAGVDLRAVAEGGREYTDRFLDAMPSAFLSVFDYPGPVVAAINGHAIAGGCVIAMSADVRLMSAGTIGLTEVAVGVPFPASALEICRYAMGPSVSGAMLRADNVDAQTALARGWIDAVVPPDDLLTQAIATARALGAHSPFAYAATKKQLHRPARAAIDASTEIDPQVRAGWLSDETFARIAAFVDELKR
jgi:enoyl-CoA hydratase